MDSLTMRGVENIDGFCTLSSYSLKSLLCPAKSVSLITAVYARPVPSFTEFSFNLSKMIAYVRFMNKDSPVLPNNVYWYHNNKVDPYWANAYSHEVTIGDHLFYSDR